MTGEYMFHRKICLSRSVTAALESARAALQTHAGLITLTEIDARPFQSNDGTRGCEVVGSFCSEERMNRKFEAIIWLVEEEGKYIELTSKRYQEYRPYRGSLYFPPIAGDHGEDKRFDLQWADGTIQITEAL